MKGFERQLYILEEIRRIFDLYEVDAVAIENYSYGSHGNAIIQLAELGGILRFYLYEKKIPFQVFSPQTVKSFLLGKGNKKMPRKESKELMLKTAQRMAFLKFKNDDEADAYTLARLKISIELNKQGLPFSLNEHQAKIVEKWSKV
jgi:Holliday junction resolvasome RuvABC endonuclease subunit